MISFFLANPDSNYTDDIINPREFTMGDGKNFGLRVMNSLYVSGLSTADALFAFLSTTVKHGWPL